jgi:hypothetical protein
MPYEVAHVHFGGLLPVCSPKGEETEETFFAETAWEAFLGKELLRRDPLLRRASNLYAPKVDMSHEVSRFCPPT